ncbi:MAG: hypothetical protein MUF15_26585 [Acidobacteria bacterium]|nr:hypothetical protein [Acidobacteriota bacterium]
MAGEKELVIGGEEFTGYLAIGNQLKPLPLGATQWILEGGYFIGSRGQGLLGVTGWYLSKKIPRAGRCEKI